MIKLTSQQKVWALRWAADYLEQHGDEDRALESLRHCADMTEKHCIPDSYDVIEHELVMYLIDITTSEDSMTKFAVIDDKDAAE